MNAYVSLNLFKGQGMANLSGGAIDTRLRQLAEGVSRQIDDYCGRYFYSRTQTRYFSGNGRAELWLPAGWDLIAITTLKEDEDRDAVYETTWATTDYELYPYGANPTGDVSQAQPYYKLEVNLRDNGDQSCFGIGQRRFELAGKWGYSESTEDTEATINEGPEYSASDTTLTVSDPAKVSIGDTLLIESEQIYVTDQVNIGGPDFTVARGVNGTTASAHANGTSISRSLYPNPVVEAALEMMGQSLTRRSSGYSSGAGFAETGIVRPISDLPLSVRQKLDVYRVLGV